LAYAAHFSLHKGLVANPLCGFTYGNPAGVTVGNNEELQRKARFCAAKCAQNQKSAAKSISRLCQIQNFSEIGIPTENLSDSDPDFKTKIRANFYRKRQF
jgi:hypothetical protein